jgi:PAS domain S-box-containing protein
MMAKSSLCADSIEENATSAFFQQLLSQLDQLVFVKDQSGHIIYVNDAFSTFIGLPSASYMGKKAPEIFESDEHFHKAQKQDYQVIMAENGYTLKSVEQYAARPGVPMQLTKRKFLFGDEPFLIGVLVDISDLKHSEEELRRSHQQLEDKIDQIKKTESKLIESEKMASIGHLTAGLAHEIGNPINYVAGSVVPIKRDFDDLHMQLIALKQARQQGDLKTTDQILDYLLGETFFHAFGEIGQLLDHIEEGSDRVKKLLASLKSFTKSTETTITYTDVNQVVNQTLKLISHTVLPGVSLATMLDDDLPRIYTNSSQLAQVFMHLIKNALQSLRGDGRVLITTTYQNPNIQITIKDNGIGMSEELKKKVFEPFFTTKEVGTGMGLGLSISLSIINQIGGSLDIDSEPEKGTLVTILIPADA